jgi:GWxTD domain-containing protein
MVRLKLWAIALVGLILAVSAAHAAPPRPAPFAGPEQLLLTDAEKQAWQAINSDEEAARFVALFWAKRDPDLSTPQNEFKEEFDRRVAAADRLFARSQLRGAMSDRGRVLILLGLCDKHYEIARGMARGSARFQAVTDYGTKGYTYVEDPASEIWEYEWARFPMLPSREKLEVVFTETEPGRQDFVFSRVARSNTHAIRVLDLARGWTVKHPDLKEPPAPGLLTGSLALSAEQRRWLDATPRPWPPEAELIALEGLTEGPQRYLWVHASLPGTDARDMVVAGRLRRADAAAEEGSFAVAVAPLVPDGARQYELSIPVATGTWQLDLAYAVAGTPIAVTSVPVTVAGLPEATTVLGPLVWGAGLEQRPEGKAGDPFFLGGWHVRARPSRAFRGNETLGYLACVLRPPTDATGAATLSLRTSVMRDGAQVYGKPAAPARLSRLGADAWLLGGNLSLRNLGEAGNYTLRIELASPEGGLTWSEELGFTIIKPRT